MASSKKKQVSTARANAEKKLKAAGSDQEKRVARAELNRVKFIEIAPARMTRALSALGNVEKLANRRGFNYEELHAKKIIDALETKVKAIRDAFTSTNGEAKSGGFSF